MTEQQPKLPNIEIPKEYPVMVDSASKVMRPKADHTAITGVQMVVPENTEVKRSFWSTTLLWRNEIRALMISSAVLAALIAVLYHFDGKPYENTVISRLTLSGLVALLAIVIRAGLLFAVSACISQSKWIWFTPSDGRTSAPAGRPLKNLEQFDKASRGAFGSLRLLFTTGWCPSVCLGAMLMVLGPLSDAFSQQTVATTSLILSSNDGEAVGQVLRAQRYFALDALTGGMTVDPSNYNMLMRAAINNAIFNVQATVPPIYCSSGNCTWPTTPTLDTCSACSNVTNQISIHTSSSSESQSTKTWTLPSGTNITYSKEGGGETYDLFRVAEGVGQIYDNTNFPERQFLTQFEAIGVPYNYTGPPNTVTAVECGLWVCVHAYNISVKSNTVYQTVAATSSDFRYNETNESWDMANLTETFNAPSTVFSVDLETVKDTQVIFSTILPGDLYFTTTGMGYAITGDNSITALGLWPASRDWNSWIENLAQLAGNAVRSTGSSNFSSSTYGGTSQTTIIVFQIRWAWITFTAAISLLSYVYVLMVIWQTYRRRVYVMKERALALVSTLLDDEILERAKSHSQGLEDFLRKLGDSKVVLEENQRFLELREVKQT